MGDGAKDPEASGVGHGGDHVAAGVGWGPRIRRPDIPGAALHEGLSWECQAFGEYLDAVDRVPHDIDVAAQVPHGAVRLHVVGERGVRREAAPPGDTHE